MPTQLGDVNTAALKNYIPQYKMLLIRCKQDVINVLPVNHPPTLKQAAGNNKHPDQPINIKRSLFNQSSIKINAPFRYLLLTKSGQNKVNYNINNQTLNLQLIKTNHNYRITAKYITINT